MKQIIIIIGWVLVGFGTGRVISLSFPLFQSDLNLLHAVEPSQVFIPLLCIIGGLIAIVLSQLFTKRE